MLAMSRRHERLLSFTLHDLSMDIVWDVLFRYDLLAV